MIESDEQTNQLSKQFRSLLADDKMHAFWVFLLFIVVGYVCIQRLKICVCTPTRHTIASTQHVYMFICEKDYHRISYRRTHKNTCNDDTWSLEFYRHCLVKSCVVWEGLFTIANHSFIKRLHTHTLYMRNIYNINDCVCPTNGFCFEFKIWIWYATVERRITIHPALYAQSRRPRRVRCFFFFFIHTKSIYLVKL